MIMISICIILGTVLLIIGIVICHLTRARPETRNGTHSRGSPSAPPPLPQRRGARAATGTRRPQRVRRTSSNHPPQLPVRHSVVLAADGPRGLSPYKFPCCPIDRQRNVEGEPQRIFWDSTQQCYRCSKNHSFKLNGRL